MQVLWTVEGRECAARFMIEAEARNFCDQLRTRHGAQDIQLLDEDGVLVTLQYALITQNISF